MWEFSSAVASGTGISAGRNGFRKHSSAEGVDGMTKRALGAALLVGTVAMTLLSAPVAGARPTCHDAGSNIRCETNGSVSIKAVPTTRAPNAGMMMPRRGGMGMWMW